MQPSAAWGRGVGEPALRSRQRGAWVFPPIPSTDARNALRPAALPQPGGYRPYLRRGLARLPFEPAPAATSASDEINPPETPAPGAPSPSLRRLRVCGGRGVAALPLRQ